MKIPCDGGPLDGQVVDVPLTRDGRPPENITAMWPALPAWATYGDPNPDLIIEEPRLHHYALGQWKCDVHGHEPPALPLNTVRETCPFGSPPNTAATRTSQ